MSVEVDALSEFRTSIRDFLEREAVPHQAEWEECGIVDRSFWEKAGRAGLLGTGVRPEYGGLGQSDYRFAAAVTEELVRAGVTAPGIVSHSDVVASYIVTLGTKEQRQRWLPDLCRGKRIAAIAVTEARGGSNSAEIGTSARIDGDNYIVDGDKTYITNGVNADLVVVAVKTSEERKGQGISLLAIERECPGFTRGPLLKKIGWQASDTAQLFFDNCVVPRTNLIGREGLGNLHFMSAMPRERLSISTVAVTSAETVLRDTLAYVKERKAFGQSIGSFQYNRFMLAQIDTEVKIARTYLDESMKRFNKNAFDMVDAARLKWWTTELQMKVADRCLQLHGGAGYMSESSVGRNWMNSRAQTIYGGTSEVLQEMISKSMGL